MNNTEKLLRAFIEASGFEIEEIPKTDMVIDMNGGVDWLGPYPTSTTVTTVDYKVTKKDTQVCFDINSPEWGCIVKYITDHDVDIETDTNDYGDLYPMLDFFNRKS